MAKNIFSNFIQMDKYLKYAQGILATVIPEIDPVGVFFESKIIYILFSSLASSVADHQAC